MAETFAQKVEEAQPRYKNLQLGRVITLANLCSDEQIVEAMEYCVSVDICTEAEMTAFFIFRHGKEYALKRISKNAYLSNRERAEEIRREQYGRHK